MHHAGCMVHDEVCIRDVLHALDAGGCRGPDHATLMHVLCAGRQGRGIAGTWLLCPYY